EFTNYAKHGGDRRRSGEETKKCALQSTHDCRSGNQQAIRAFRWGRARSAAQLSAPSTWPNERANLFDSRGCTRSRRQAILGGAARAHAGGTQRHRKRYGIAQERTAIRAIRYTFTFRRRKAGDTEVLSRPLQADRAAVFPGGRRLSDRSFSTFDRRIPGLRADTPAMNLAVLSFCRARPFKGTIQQYRAGRDNHHAGANIEISRRNAAGLERERCRLRSRGAAKHPKTMPAGPFLFTSNRGNLCVWHKRHSENDSDYFSGAGSSRVSASSKDRRVFSGHLRA